MTNTKMPRQDLKFLDRGISIEQLKELNTKKIKELTKASKNTKIIIGRL